MPDFGGMNLFGFDLGGGPADEEATYEALKDGRGTAYSRDDSTVANAELRCIAYALTRAKATQARGAWQAFGDEAQDLIPDWEARLGIIPGPEENDTDRRAMIQATRKAASLLPYYTNIVSVLEEALGEPVSVTTERAHVNDQSPPSLIGMGLPSHFAVAQPTGGNLQAGVHYVAAAYVDAAGNVGGISALGTPTVVLGGSILAGNIGPSGDAVAVNWYLSTAPGLQLLAFAARGALSGSVLLGAYPTNPALPGLHHLSIGVSARTKSDPLRVSKIHRLLGTMLSAWTTYSITCGSPFILGSSPLGPLGAF